MVVVNFAITISITTLSFLIQGTECVDTKPTISKPADVNEPTKQRCGDCDGDGVFECCGLYRICEVSISLLLPYKLTDTLAQFCYFIHVTSIIREE